MNNLSWFIYFTQVVSSFQAVGVGLIIISGVATLITGAIFLAEDGNSEWKRPIKLILSVAALGLLLAVGLPTHRTMVLIAASELGERAVRNQTVQSVVDPSLDLIRAWIVKETEKLGSPK